MQRILIIGSSGAGKSTLSRKLHQKLGIPLIHLDQHYWQSGWVEPPKPEWNKRVAKLVEAPQWIMDGNFGSSLPIRLPRADTVILLNYPTWLCILRVFQRYARYLGKTRPDMGPNCPEQFDWEFLHYIYGFKKKHLPRALKNMEEYGAHTHKIILSSPRATRRFLRGLS